MPVRYGYVVGTIIDIHADGPDEGRLPDIKGATSVKPRFVPVKETFASSELEAIVNLKPYEGTVREDGALLDAQGSEGIWMVAGTYKVERVPGVKQITVTPSHTEELPLNLWTAVDYVPAPGTPVQTMLVPSGASEGQVLAWVGGYLSWVGAGEGGVTTWASLPGKPAEFPPADHSHVIDDVEGLQAALDAAASSGGGGETVDLSDYPTNDEVADALALKADVVHTHPEYLTAEDLPAPPDLSGYVQTTDARLTDARTPIAHTHAWADVTGKPTTFPPAAHTHPEYGVNYDTIPPGSTITVYWNNTTSSWPTRPTERTDITVVWADHHGTSTAPTGNVAGVDRYTHRDTP